MFFPDGFGPSVQPAVGLVVSTTAVVSVSELFAVSGSSSSADAVTVSVKRPGPDGVTVTTIVSLPPAGIDAYAQLTVVAVNVHAAGETAVLEPGPESVSDTATLVASAGPAFATWIVYVTF